MIAFGKWSGIQLQSMDTYYVALEHNKAFTFIHSLKTSGVGATTHVTVSLEKRGGRPFSMTSTTFPQASLVTIAGICMQRKSSNAPIWGIFPQKRKMNRSRGNHEVPMRDGAATAPSMDQRAIRRSKYVPNRLLAHMQP